MPIYSIVLAAGKGRRMRNEVIHKVCFEIAGIPAVHRALDAYNRIGVVQNVVVVGELAGQVVETVGRKFRNVVFAYQPDARGTGDAARCGLQALTGLDPDDRILIVAGDKLIANSALTRLVNECERTDADLGLLVTPAQWGGASAGRLLFDKDERPAAIAELADIKLRRCRAALRSLAESPGDETLTFDEVQAVIAQHLGRSATLASALDSSPADSRPLTRSRLREQMSALPQDFRVGRPERIWSADDALAAPYRNESVYLVKKRAIDFGIENLPINNAQGELYLTDAIGAICVAGDANGRRFRVCHVPTETRHEVMSYNNPEELLQIQDYFHGERHQSSADLRNRLGEARYKSIDDWLALFPESGPLSAETRRALTDYYGDDEELLTEKSRAYRRVLTCFREQFGSDRSVILVRSPGRINVMGRHIDWQGGRCNLMAVTQEVLMAVAPRDDDLVQARNVDPEQFEDVSISIGGLVSQLDWDDWLTLVNSGQLVRHLREAAGRWSLYIEAALLRLQMAFRDQVVRGMDIAVAGNIPLAAGLSSSSALVVATAESALALNDLEVTSQQFVNFCGEGEWFVGTRGGSADHAAMKYGAKGTINHVGFHDFELIEQLKFPASHALVVCNSFVQARKAAGAKEAFNSRVGSYLVGVELVKRRCPQFAPFIRFVRDINSETLRVPLSQVYEILLQLPETITAADVRELFSQDESVWPTLAPHFVHAPNDARYPVRGVVLFGIAECARARRAAECLARNDMDQLGRLMQISHDGERCFSTRADGSVEPFQVDISDAAIHGLIDDLNSQDPDRVASAQLAQQPGAYRCSTLEIDTIVDIACRTPGIAGAQIAGAGLGGCAMVLVQADAADELERNLLEQFYRPNNLPNGVIRCTPSAGSCVVAIPGNGAQR